MVKTDENGMKVVIALVGESDKKVVKNVDVVSPFSATRLNLILYQLFLKGVLQLI